MWCVAWINKSYWIINLKKINVKQHRLYLVWSLSVLASWLVMNATTCMCGFQLRKQAYTIRQWQVRGHDEEVWSMPMWKRELPHTIPPQTNIEMVHLFGCLVESQKVDHVLVLSIWHSRNTDSFFSWKVEVSFGLMKIHLWRQWCISLFGQHISWATLIGSLHSFSFPQPLIPPQETGFWYAAILS